MMEYVNAANVEKTERKQSQIQREERQMLLPLLLF